MSESTTTTAVAQAAFEAYRENNDLHPADELPYEDAREHCHGDTLADFLVVELTEGVEGAEDIEEEYYRAVDLLTSAISDLEYVKHSLVAEQRERQSDAV